MSSIVCRVLPWLLLASLVQADDAKRTVTVNLGTSQGRTLGAYWVALSPDGTQLAYRTDVDSISIFAPATGKLLRTVKITEKEVGEQLHFTRDSKRLLLQSMQHLRVVDPTTGKVERKIGLDDKFDIYSHEFAWDAAVTRVVTCSSNFNFKNNPPVRFWNATANTIEGEVKIGPSGAGRSLAVSGDGKIIATGAQSHQKANEKDEAAEEYVEFWNSRTRERVARLHMGANVQPGRLYLNSDGTILLTVDSVGRWAIWDVKASKTIATLGQLPGFNASITFSPNDKLVAIQTSSSVTKVYETATGKLKHERKDAGQKGGGVGFTAEGDIYACFVEGTQVRVSNLTKPEQPPTPPSDGHRQPVFFTHFAADSKTILTVGSDQRVLRWDVATGKLLEQILDQSSERSHFWSGPCAVSPDGKRLIVVSAGGANLIDLEKKEHLGFLSINQKYRPTWSRFDFAADGKTLFARGTGQETGRTDFKIVILPYVVEWNLDEKRAIAEHLGATRDTPEDDVFKAHFGTRKLAAGVKPSVEVTVGKALRDPWASNFNAGAIAVGSTVTIKNAAGKVLFEETISTHMGLGISISPDGKKSAIPRSNGTVAIIE